MMPTSASAPLSQQNTGNTLLCICTKFPILGGSPHGVLCLLDLFGVGSPTTSPTGRGAVCTANRARSIATLACCRSPSPSLSEGFLISTLTRWALCSMVIIAISFSPSLIAHPNGWKLFHFLTFPQRRAHML